MLGILFGTDWTLRIMIKKDIKYFCRNFTEIENYKVAVSDKTQIWECHHKREIEENKTSEQLIKEGLYYNRPPEELIFLTKYEHHQLHINTEEYKKRISDKLKGRIFSEETRMKMSINNVGNKGRQFSEETRRKMSEAAKRRCKKLKV